MEAKGYFSLFDTRLTEGKQPSRFINELAESGRFPACYPFSLILNLKEVPQSPVHHPEGSVWNHTMMVVDAAAGFRHLSSVPRVFVWAALLHDLGKAPTTRVRKGRITSYDHDIEGEKLARDFLEKCTDDSGFIYRVCALVRWHMQPMFVLKSLPFADINAMKAMADPREVALLYFCDRLGRGELSEDDIKNELKGVESFLKSCGLSGDDSFINSAFRELAAAGTKNSV